jgi:DNA-binding MarR family transcriptional regulator
MLMNYSYFDELLKASKDSPVGLRLMLYFFKYMDESNNLVCSNNILADEMKCSPSTITKAVRFLKENSFVEVKKSGTTNMFHVSENLALKHYE